MNYQKVKKKLKNTIINKNGKKYEKVPHLLKKKIKN